MPFSWSANVHCPFTTAPTPTSRMLSGHGHCSPQHPLPTLTPIVWSTLPIELATQTLLHVSFSSHADAHALCLISSTMHRAVLPALYHNLLLCHAAQFPAFISPFTTSTIQHLSRCSSSPQAGNTKARFPIHTFTPALPSLRFARSHAYLHLTELSLQTVTLPLFGANPMCLPRRQHWNM